MKPYTLMIISIICSLLVAPFAAAEDNNNPIAAANAFQFNPGTIAPPIRLDDLSGNRVDLADFKGQVVLINFWATW